MSALFEEAKLGQLRLPNRIVMAPLTRNRAERSGVPGPSAAVYYGQRASAGLIISEGIQPSPVGQGFFCTPGLHTPQQQAGWRQVTDEVHRRGGRILAQLMHAGRIGHPDLYRYSNLPAGQLPVAPSAIRPAGMAKTYDGPREFVTPRQLSIADIAGTVADFAAAASNAIAAGFDGVELHGASGMLLHQFLADGCNDRLDRYGGSVSNRIRFVVEVAQAVAEAIGADRVGVRISPHNAFNDVREGDAPAVYLALTAELARLDLAYLHLYETLDRDGTMLLRSRWPAMFILNPHRHDRRSPAAAQAAVEALVDDAADLISFGRLFISNPDLPRRIRYGLPITPPDPATFYGGDDHGYTDYQGSAG